jgi:hypothetical protein
MVLGSTQALTEKTTAGGRYRWLVRRADNLTTFMYRLSRNLGSSTFGYLWACPGLYKNCFTEFYITVHLDICI